MKRSSWVVLAAICVLGILLAYFQSAGRTKPSDEEQIQTFMTKGQQAIEQKDLKGMLSCISKDYHDRYELTFDKLRLHSIQALRAEGKYDVLLEDVTIRVTGDTAVAQTKVSVSLMSGDNDGLHRLFSKPVTLHLRKEQSKRLLVFRTAVWKVTRLDGLPDEFTD